MQETLDYLYNLKVFGSKLGLENMRQLMEALNFPYRKFPAVHIAGTNGKGSTCAFLSLILREAGYKVGLYTSPHLIKFNERIRINGKEITDEELVNLTKQIKKVIETNKISTTFFEFTTALAFLYFAQENVDIAIIEVGLGGKLDATNVIIPEVAGITNISFDHTKILGETKKEIAYEKAGIIKSGVPVVCGEEDSEIFDYLQSLANERGSTFVASEKEPLFEIGLEGEHQKKNASLALTILNILEKKGFPVKNKDKKNGLLKVEWAGRLQKLSENVLIDGAHNEAGMKSLVSYVKKLENRKVLVLAFAKDKEFAKMVPMIVPLFERIIITKGSFKPEETAVISKEVRKYTKNVQEIPLITEAIEKATNISEGGLILFTGSLYMAGDVLKSRNLFK